MRVLVTGATGFVGGRLVPALLEAGHDVVAMVRDPGAYDPPAGVEVVRGDVLDRESLAGAFDGVEAAYYLIHSMDAGEGDFAARDREGARNFAEAASSGDVERVVYLGGLGVESEDLSKHLRSRREVEAVLDEGDYDLTVLRAAIVVGAGSASFELIHQLVTRLPVMIAPRWVRTECQPIAIDDVLGYLVGVLSVPETADDTFEIGGPDVLTYQELLRRTAELMGRRLYVVPVPVLTPRLSSYWLDLVTDLPRSITHPLVRGLGNPVVVTDHRIEELVDVDRTPLDEAIERALAGTAGRSRREAPEAGT